MDKPIEEGKLIFLYAKGEKNEVTEKDFLIDSSFSSFKCEKLIKKKYKDKEQEKEKESTILLLSSTFNPSKLKSDKKYQMTLQKSFISNEFQLFKGDNFLFNIIFEKKSSILGFMFSKQNPPETIILTDREQFSYFVNEYIKSNKLQQSPSKENLNRDVVKLFDGSFNFGFYLDVFKEIYTSKFIKNLLSKFKIEKIKLPENLEVKTHLPIMKLILKKGELIINKVEGNKKSFAERLYLILLFYFYHYVPESLNDMLKIGNGECNIDYYDLFFKNENKFLSNDKSLEIIFHYVKSIDHTIFLMKKFSNFFDCIKSIYNNLNIISELCKKERRTLNINDIPKIPQEEKLNEILSYLKEIKRFELDNNIKILNLDVNFWEKIISNCGNDVEHFQELMEIIEQNEDEKIKNGLKPLIEDKQHEICQKFIIQSNEKNEQILEWICRDPIFKIEKGKNKLIDEKKKMNIIIEKIDLDELNSENIDKFFEIYNEINFKNILPENTYINFCNGIIEKIKNFETFNLIFRLINFEDKQWEILNTVQKKYLELLNNSKGKSENFKEITSQYLRKNMDIGYLNEIEKILNEIEKMFDKENIKLLYMDFIEIVAGKNEKITSRLVKYFTGDLKNATNTTIKVLLNGIKDEYALKQLLISFTPLAFSETEFYQKEESEKFKIFQSLNEFGYLQSKILKKTDYYKKISEVSELIIQKLKNNNFNLENALDIKNIENNIRERLKLICFEEKNQNLDIYNPLMENINKFISWENKISEINKYINFFLQDDSNKKSINELNNEICQKNFNDIIPKEKDIETFIKNYYENAKTFNKLHQSEFFNCIYKYHKINNPDNRLEYSKEDFEKLDNLFDEKKFSEIETEIFNTVLNEIKSKEFLTKEFNLLKKYFNKDEDLDTSMVENQLMILSSKNKMIKTIEGILIIIDELDIEKGDFYKDLNKTKKNLDESVDVDDLKSIIEFLTKNKIDIIGEKNFTIVINKLTEKKDLIKFLKDKDVEGLRNLIEFVGEDDNSSLKASDIQDFLRCIQFINDLKTFKNKKDVDFYNELIKICQSEKYKNIEAYFEKVNQNFYEIKDLITKNIDKSEFTKQKVKDLYNNSFFQIKNSNGIFHCDVFYAKDLSKKISYEEVLEVRDRSLLKKKDEEENEKKENFYEIAQDFSKKINQIDNLIDYINEICAKGYPDDISYDIKIIEGKMILTDSVKKKFNIDQVMKELTKLLKTQIVEQEKAYKENSIIRFLYGRHFYLLTKFLRFGNCDVNHFLKYLTNNNYNQEIEFTFIKRNNNPVLDSITNAINFLTELLKKNNITEENIFKQNIINNGNYVGLKSFFSYKDEVSQNIVKIYQNLTGNPPLAQTILLCSDSTTTEEITAFMYKSILCNYNVLFSIVKVEILEIEKRYMILEFLDKLYIENLTKMKSCLVFIYNDRNTDFMQEIFKKQNHQNLVINDNTNINNIQLKDETIEIFYSNACGVGKSTLIKSQTEENKKEYKYFPIGGEFTILEIINRLNSLNLNENSVLHFDLCDSAKVELMKDFLFSFLITKLCSSGENIFYLGNKIQIKIEIPFGFIDFFKKFPVLNLFKKKLISIEQKPTLKIDNKVYSNIQIACNYLKLFKEKTISENNLYIDKISQTEFLPSIKSSSLDQQTCENLIKEFFSIQNPTFYQITCFINIIASQLKEFTNNYYLSVGFLKEVGGLKSQNDLNTIREYIINALVLNTMHFTQGAYGKLIKSQETAQEIQTNEDGTYDENNVLNEAIKSLTQREVISYKQIKPSLIFSNLDGASLSIITNCEENSEEYKILKKLYNSDSDNNKKKLINYQTLSSEEFLPELKKVLNLKNEVDKESTLTWDEEIEENGEKKKIKKERKLKSIKDVVGSYVFTADNFIKMILVLFRIQANIPVIMMGETGCGKTSLIRIMAQLMEINMKILNIHAGVNDNDIMEFMLGKTKDNHQNLLDTDFENRKKAKVIEEKKHLELLEKMVFDIEDEMTKLPNESDDQFLMRKAEEITKLKNKIKMNKIV